MDVNTLLITDRQKIIEVNGKTREQIDQDIDIIMEWFKTQKHLPEVLSRNAIERNLVISKFSIERTKKICDMYYTARSLIPDVFINCSSNNTDQTVYMDKVFYYIPLPKLTSEFYRVNIIKFKDFEHPNYNPMNFLTQVHLIFEVMLQEELSMGDVVILDFKHMKRSYIMKSNLMHLKTANFFLEYIWASRMKGMHFINVPSYAQNIISLSKTIMKQKLKERLHVHNSSQKLFDFVPKEILPKDYGGDEKSLDELNELWKLKLQKYEPYLERLLKIKVDEKLRPEPLKNSDILGFYGNFKKIDVD